MGYPYKTIKPLCETDKAYLAGIMDGEGAIYISRKITDITGLGSWHPMKRYSEKHKQAYRWDAWSMQAGQILDAIMPYLKQKHERALLAIELLKHTTYKGYLTEDQYNLQKTYDKMKILNKRGA